LSDGSALAFGDNQKGQCDIPPLAPGLAYTRVAAAAAQTLLLRSDGTAVAYGQNHKQQCNIPPLAPGLTYTHVAAGAAHSVLLLSDGTAVAVGQNHKGQCDIPPLAPGLTYIHAAAGEAHTVLLVSDGTAVAIGQRNQHQCDIPLLDTGLFYTHAAVKMMLQASFDGGLLRLTNLGGTAVCQISATATDRLTDLQSRLTPLVHAPFDVILPSGGVLGTVLQQEPLAVLGDFLAA